jgi:hypothetical protein
MTNDRTFKFSVAEARRMRRGAFLPIVLIVPMVAMFGLDSSKSQPMHFLMTLTVAAGITAVVVSMGWYGANRRIAELSATSLSIEEGKIIWAKGQRRTEFDLHEVRKIHAWKTRNSVRAIVLIRKNGARTTLEGFQRMNDMLDELQQQAHAEVVVNSRWFGL